MFFNLQTDGKEYDDIIVPDGGFRNRTSNESFTVKEFEKGILRNALDMKLDGIKIFNFALREIAPNVNELLNTNSIQNQYIRRASRTGCIGFVLGLYCFGIFRGCSFVLSLCFAGFAFDATDRF